MKRFLITGMSGTGKTSVIEALRERGFDAIDTDYDDWCELSTRDGEEEWIWREDRMHALLAAPPTAPLFVSGCVSNQGRFYPFFDCKILLDAPLEVILQRVATRTTNPYGKSEEDRAAICENYAYVVPLLRKSVDITIDTTVTDIPEVTEYLVGLAQAEEG